jgi:hypothetical protein
MEDWHRESSYLVLLSVPDENELNALQARIEALDHPYSAYHEPDFDGALTALSIAPSPVIQRLLSAYPLTGKEPVMT